MRTEEKGTIISDGSTASYYELPAGASELQHLISYKDMNAQVGEIFRACYRYGEVSHSDRLRDIRKMKYYAAAEEERLMAEIIKYNENDLGEFDKPPWGLDELDRLNIRPTPDHSEELPESE